MIAVLKYNAGNIRSVLNALGRLGVEAELTDDPAKLASADKVIFPGVGEAGSAMRYLRERNLDEAIRNLRQPVLGICLGLQLLCQHSEEGDTEGLGIFSQQVRLFPPREKVPHMGWNNLQAPQGSLFRDLPVEADYYFVHSYCAELGPDTAATCDYIEPFSAALVRDNFYAVQFHPEKSGAEGARLLQNFLSL